MKETMDAAGVYELARIKEGWEKYHKENQTLYDYTKAFYWTLLNSFDAYRVASTGAFKQNVSHTED